MSADAPEIHVAVDLTVLTLRDGALSVLLIQREDEPHRGKWALPGGFIIPGEDLEEAAYRVLADEASLGSGAVHLEQVRTFGTPGRDPRGHVVSVRPCPVRSAATRWLTLAGGRSPASTAWGSPSTTARCWPSPWTAPARSSRTRHSRSPSCPRSSPSPSCAASTRASGGPRSTLATSIARPRAPRASSRSWIVMRRRRAGGPHASTAPAAATRSCRRCCAPATDDSRRRTRPTATAPRDLRRSARRGLGRGRIEP